MHYLDAAALMDDHFGWHIDIQLKETGKIVVTRPDDEVVVYTRTEFEEVAQEMWETVKNNGLDPEIIKEVEESYFKLS